jgi:D-alanine-D-alanine ligase
MIPKGARQQGIKIQVLAGGISHERDISLKSGRRLADALTDAGANVVLREPDHQLLDNIRKDAPDVIWPVVHGSTGEDGALRDVLLLSGVPFVGAGPDGARLAWDKAIAKILVAREGIQTPASITLPKETFRDLNPNELFEAIVAQISLPLVVKPAKSGSAQGVTVVERADQLARAMVDAYVYCDTAILEQFVAGTELAVSVIDLGAGPIALPAVEIEPVEGRYGYDERYTAGETNFYVPARLSEKAAQASAHLAIKAHETLGLRHLSRIDIIVDEAGVPWFLEANVAPGLTETSLLPQAVVASGNSLSDAYLSVAQAAIRQR